MVFFTVDDDDAAPFAATVNGGGNKINFRALDENQDVLLKTDSEAFNVGLYYAGTKKLETTTGGITITGSISASSDISASGNLIVNDITASGDIVLDEDQRIYFEEDKATWAESHAADSFRVVVNSRQMLLLDEDTGNRAVFGNGTKVFIGENNNKIPTASLHVAGDIWASGSNSSGIDGHITASGNISSSNAVIGTTGSFDIISRVGDPDTRILFTDDDINIRVGGINMIDFTEDTNDEITINEEAADLDVRIEGEDDPNLLFTDATTPGRVGIGTNAPTEKLTVDGNISGSGNLIISDITASGNISITGSGTGSFSSLQVDGASVDFTNLPTSDPGVAGRLWNDSNTLKISAG
jgi:hypothetical protein